MNYSTKKSLPKWLKLQLRDDQRIENRYIILHTHFAIYNHLCEQGFNLACYEAANYQKNEPNAVLYIKTDHEGFYQSCLHYYAYDFVLTELGADFELPAHYRLFVGKDEVVSELAS